MWHHRTQIIALHWQTISFPLTLLTTTNTMFLRGIIVCYRERNLQTSSRRCFAFLCSMVLMSQIQRNKFPLLVSVDFFSSSWLDRCLSSNGALVALEWLFKIRKSAELARRLRLKQRQQRWFFHFTPWHVTCQQWHSMSISLTSHHLIGSIKSVYDMFFLSKVHWAVYNILWVSLIHSIIKW